ncbi:unnamed protein product [Allacma fusca]|uniref:Uncharacterized protein n=1 Tax=Allacma fusca TaxID=39272 RepID=A0A8J2JGQ3_9HEXA|nr:unnamed protein product [Allacma fusca]
MDEGARLISLIRWSFYPVFLTNLLVLVVHGTELILNGNGCPYAFDFGTLGFEYVKPNICTTMMSPLWDGKTPAINHANPNMTTPIDTYVTLKNGMLDTWIVTFTVPSRQSFRFADFIIKSYEINPNGSLGGGAGHFDRKYDFVPYCCDVAKRRNMIRFANLKGQRPTRVEMIWSPLRFKGKVKFMGNFFGSPSKWYKNAGSTQAYKVPAFAFQRKENMYYDEDWKYENIPEF